ncbi:hypothetical protein ACHAWF_015164, partial [Thalassiosira exigua]
MMYWRHKISYEIRKGLHLLFYVFAVALCWHVPPSAMPNGGFLPYILGGSIVLYTLDRIYVSLFMTEKIETTAFHVLSSGVRISMPVSDRFIRKSQRAGFAYINLPWVDDKQWHPFSLFEDPSDPRVQQMFLMKAGDWTKAVHSTLSRDTTRPVWIRGPFPSPYGQAAMYDNQILVASGIGITPALGAINAFKGNRRINLIWAVRDPEMLEFFLEHMYLDHDGWNLIFYTGKKPLPPHMDKISSNIQVIKGRPKLDSVIPNVIYGIETGEGLPERYTERSKDEMRARLVNRVGEIRCNESIRPSVKVAMLKEYGESLGFALSEHSIDETPDGDEAETLLGALDTPLKDALDTFDAKMHWKDMQPNIQKSSRNVKEVSYDIEDKSKDVLEADAEQFLVGLESAVVELGKLEQDHASEPAAVGRTRSLSNVSSVMWKSIAAGVGCKDSVMLEPAFSPWVEKKSQE